MEPYQRDYSHITWDTIIHNLSIAAPAFLEEVQGWGQMEPKLLSYLKKGNIKGLLIEIAIMHPKGETARDTIFAINDKLKEEQ